MDNQNVDWLKIARNMLRSRELDLHEEQQLAPQGKVKYQFSAKGHELSQVLLAQTLDRPHDAAAVYYRSRPFMLASGLSLVEALSADMALADNPSEGRDVGVVFNRPGRGGLTVLPSSGDVGAQYSPAAGWAQAICYHFQTLGEKDWENSIAVALGGDGSIATNGFWAALNIATTIQLPLLFFIEDNKYGISVPASYQTPGGNIAANLSSYRNLTVLDGDGTDPEQTWDLIQSAIEHVRSWNGPCLLHLEVPRLQGHTFIDDQSYKSPELRAAEAERDPIPRLRSFLLEKEWIDDEGWDKMREEVRAELATAVEQALGLPQPDPAQATRYLFFEGETQKQGGLRPGNHELPACIPEPETSGPRINFIDAVRRTLEAEMRRNPRVLIFGEDVGAKGGVHGATMDMQAHFGEERVFDTSLSEEGIIGRATGMALSGLLPVPEIQFRKYADPAYEQIDDLGTIRWRTANNFAAPVVVRIPLGFGKKTGDPWHSVTAEATYAHLLGWRIAFPSNAVDAVGLLRSALRGDDPTIFFEHRALLDTAEGRRPYPGDDYCLPFGQAATLTQGDELSVVTWGAMVHRCLAAGKGFPGQVSILDLRTIIPWDRETVLESVRKTGKVLIVHEDTITAGFGAEIAATVAHETFTFLDAPIQRLATPDTPVPFNIPMMNALLPSVESIRQKMAEILAF